MRLHIFINNFLFIHPLGMNLEEDEEVKDHESMCRKNAMNSSYFLAIPRRAVS